MFLEKFKVSKGIELGKAIKAYVTNHYDMNAVKSVESICNEIDFARNAAILVNDSDKSAEGLQKIKTSIVDYLKLLNTIKMRMTFGKDDMSVKVSFTWSDVLKKDNFSSSSYAHEYYNMLFNLAIAMFNLGKTVKIDESEDALKQSVKQFKEAAWIFDKIKQESPSLLNPPQPDLTSAYLTYCNYMCLAHAQFLVYVVSERKNLNFELQAQLAKGIVDMFASCSQLLEENLKKYTNDLTRMYLMNRRYYYTSLSFQKMKEFFMEDFKNKGIGYGKMIAYISLARDAINAGAKDLKIISSLVDVDDYIKQCKKLEDEVAIMNNKNKSIYYDGVPAASTLPKIEKKMMAVPTQLSEKIDANEQYSEQLKELIPKEVKNLIDQYKMKIITYIQEKLENYHNECKIDKFLLDMNLPGALESTLSQDKLSDYLWGIISNIQQKGGPMYIESTVKNGDGLREDALKKINAINVTLMNEQDEDARLRQIYGNRWTRSPSAIVNANYLGTLTQISQKIEIARKCDEAINQSIRDNMKYFELINLSKVAIEKKIPLKVDSEGLKEIPEAKNLKDVLERLRSLKEKNTSIIESIFRELNQENVIPVFLEVLRKNASESNFYKEQIDKFDKMLNQLGELEEAISMTKIDIIKYNDAFVAVKESKLKPKPENESFFRELESYCQLYNQKLTNLHQGLNFYSGLNDKLIDLTNNVTDFIFSRDLEKNDLLKAVSSGGTNIPHNTNSK